MKTSVHAFYGFKGGAGRSLLLAHFAFMLAIKGKKVLMIDSDLEAPGLGDFFDGVANRSFERWRAKPGLIDVLGDLFRSARRKELGKRGSDHSVESYLQEFLGIGEDQEPEGIIPFRRSRDHSRPPTAQRLDQSSFHKGIWLLGPGDHRAQKNVNSSRYLDNLLSFDWQAVMRSGGQDVLTRIGEYLRSGKHGFDHILIDARTGYNFSSLLMLQNFATHVVGVTSWNSQAIDGMARTLPVVSSSARENENIQSLLILNKGPDDFSDGFRVKEVKEKLIEAYFENTQARSTPLFFPFIEGIQFRESLIWNRYFSAQQVLKEAVEPNDDYSFKDPNITRAEKVITFVDQLSMLYSSLTGDEFSLRNDSSDSDIRKIRGVVYSSSGVSAFSHASQMQGISASKRISELTEKVVSYFNIRRGDGAADIESKDNQPLGGKASDIVFDIKAEFSALDKDSRKLLRNEVLQRLRSLKVSIDGFDVDRRTREAIREISGHLDLDLDPSDVVSIVAGKEEKDSSANMIETTDDFREVIRAFVLDINGKEVERFSASVDRFVSPGKHSEGVRVFASFLLAWRGVSAEKNFHNAAVYTRDAVRLFLESVKQLSEYPKPTTERGFGNWNIFDTLSPLVDQVSRLAVGGYTDNELADTTLELSNVVLEDLSNKSVWRNIDSLDPTAYRSRRNWCNYVDAALRLKCISEAMRSTDIEHSTCSSALSHQSFKELISTINLPDPESCLSWGWESKDQYTVEIVDRLNVANLYCALFLARFAFSSEVIEVWFRQFLSEVLRNNMTVFVGPTRELQKESLESELESWIEILLDLVRVYPSVSRSDQGFRLVRRANRLQSTISSVVQSSHHATIVLGMLNEGQWLGSNLTLDTLEEGSFFENDDSSAMKPVWFAGAECSHGRYRRASEYLFETSNRLLEAELLTSPEQQSLDAQFAYSITVAANLGMIEQAEMYRQRLEEVIKFYPDGGIRTLYAATLELLHASVYVPSGENLDYPLQLLSWCEKYCQALAPGTSRKSVSALLKIYSSRIKKGGPLPSMTDLKSSMAFFEGIAASNSQDVSKQMGGSWAGLGIFTESSINSRLFQYTASIFSIFIEVAFQRGENELAREGVAEWEKWINVDQRINEASVCTCSTFGLALFHAYSFKISGDEQHKSTAVRLAGYDIEENGNCRKAFYYTHFSKCGLPA